MDKSGVNWIALFAPANTPKGIVARLTAEEAKISKKRDVQTRFETLGAKPRSEHAKDVEALLQSETAKGERIVEAAGTKVD